MTQQQISNRQKLIGSFLRQRRESISPDVYGFPMGKRRTPGLRREEVAALAGVSVTWYSWLEQGRADGVSRTVIDSLANVLRLSADERDYLLRLSNPTKHDPYHRANVPRTSQLILNAITVPAYIMGIYWDVLCWNEMAGKVFGDFDEGDRNLLWYMFTNPKAKLVTVDWQSQAEQMVARFRADYANYTDDPSFNQLIADLSLSSTPFAELWQTQPIEQRRERSKGFNHPRLGRLTFLQSTMQLIDNPYLRLVVFMPDPHTDTAIRLREF